ncbi:MAG: lysophospholipid acyltransferase family protein [Planctomycetota bacterium]
MGGFRLFNQRYLKKHFHTLSLFRESFQPAELGGDSSVVIYANHASWWDPLLAMYLADSQFGDFRMYAPIDSEAFEKYRMFGKMGFYPVDQASLEGAGNFLRISRRILQEPGNTIWVTPEGRFCDARDHSAELMPGVGHLAHKIASQAKRSERSTATIHSDAENRDNSTDHRVGFLPLAVEYAFWEERTPEILVNFGSPIWTNSSELQGFDKSQWNEKLTDSLRQTQTNLAAASIARDSSLFHPLLKSQSGTFFVYDWWRAATNRLRGKTFDSEHSEQFK